MANDDKRKRSKTARAPALTRKRTCRASPDQRRGCSDTDSNILSSRLEERLASERVPGRANRLRDAVRSAERINAEALSGHDAWSVALHSCAISRGSPRRKTTALLKMRGHAHRRLADVRETVAKLDPSMVYEGASELRLPDGRARYPRDVKHWEVRDSFQLAQDLARLPNVEVLERPAIVSLFERIRKECAWLDRMPKPEGRKLRLQTTIARSLWVKKKDPFDENAEIDTEKFSLDEIVEIVHLPKDSDVAEFRSGLQCRLEDWHKGKSLKTREVERILRENGVTGRLNELRFQREEGRKAQDLNARFARIQAESEIIQALSRRIDQLPGSAEHKAILRALNLNAVENMLRPAPTGLQSLERHGLVAPSAVLDGWYDFTQTGWSFHTFLMEHVAPVLEEIREQKRAPTRS